MTSAALSCLPAEDRRRLDLEGFSGPGSDARALVE